MRTACCWLVTVVLALGCESPAEQPPLDSGTSGSTESGGSSGSAPSSGGSGGYAASSGGAMAQPSGGTTGGVASAGSSSGGSSSGGSSSGGSSSGDSGGSAGSSMNGGNAGEASGGAANGGSGGTAGGAGGTSGCVKNLACKLDPPPSTGDIYQDCVNRINQFLTQCACLPALERRTDGEACADQMAEYDAGKNSPHAGAKDNICQPGGSQNECPGYSSDNQVISLCLQQMWDEGPPPVNPCTGSCYEDHGHFINMTDPSVTKVACGFYTTPAGKVWAVQNFSK